MNHDAYSDAYIRDILARSRTIAMVGASPNTSRPSYFAMKYLQQKGFSVIPVNPGQAGKEILGETVYASLADIKQPIDIVDIFRSSDAALGVTREAIADRRQGGVDAAWRAQRRGGAARRGGRLAGGDESLPQDRIWPAVGRTRLGRRQFALPVEQAPLLGAKGVQHRVLRPQAIDAQPGTLASCACARCRARQEPGPTI